MRCLALVMKNQALDQGRASLSTGNGEVKAAGRGGFALEGSGKAEKEGWSRVPF